jgi:hypothetical protein
MPDLQYRISGFAPADVEAALDLWDEAIAVLVEHHTPDEADSFFVLHDGSATWGAPGAPQLIALHITRDLTARTFAIAEATHPTVPFAQRWLAERGCDPDTIRLPEGRYALPADALTSQLEEQIRHSGGRYEVKDHYTHGSEPYETWVMVRDTDPGSVDRPVRIFLEEADLKAFTYTLREGAFRDGTAANQWLFDSDTPLPEPTEHLPLARRRAQAALARSTTDPQKPATVAPSAEATTPAPASGVQQTQRGAR